MSNGNGKPTPQVDPIPPTKPGPAVAGYDFFKINALDVSASRAGTVFPEGPTLTRQEFAEDCDINVLMKRYENQDIGAIMRRAQEPVYADFAEMPQDLMGFMNFMREAENAFMTLPATVRREFDNDAAAFVDFAGDPANLDQMRSWGLAPPAPAPAPAVVAPQPGAGPPAASPPPADSTAPAK